MIYILEGPDGVGKSTLAHKIAKITKGHILHCSYKKSWDIEEYHEDILEAAILLDEYQSVVIDRWAVSEHVYGTVFRGQPIYNVLNFIKKHNTNDFKWIYCHNDNAVENHLKLAKERKEMFNDMSKVVELYDSFVNLTREVINWYDFDYDKKTFKQLWEELNDKRQLKNAA